MGLGQAASSNKEGIQLRRTSTMQECRNIDIDLLLQAQVLYHKELFPVQPYKIYMHHGYEQEIGRHGGVLSTRMTENRLQCSSSTSQSPVPFL